MLRAQCSPKPPAQRPKNTRGLTGRSRRHATALAREPRLFMMRLAGQCRCVRLTSNVRPARMLAMSKSIACFANAAPVPSPAGLLNHREMRTDLGQFVVGASRRRASPHSQFMVPAQAPERRRHVEATWSLGRHSLTGRSRRNLSNCRCFRAPPERLCWHFIMSIAQPSFIYRQRGPNRSVEATHNGIGPRGSLAHHSPRGPMPSRAPHLQR